MEMDNDSVITHLTNDTNKQFSSMPNFHMKPETSHVPLGPQEMSLAEYSKTSQLHKPKPVQEDPDEIPTIALEQFKFTVKRWIELDDQIKTLQKQARELRKVKNELAPKIQNFMQMYDIDDLNTSHSKLKLTVSKRRQGFSQKLMKQRLVDYFDNEDQADKLMKFALSHREVKEVVSLRRYKNKN